MINVFSKTDIGRVRKVNQDAVKTEVISDNLAWSVVCDGMGGQAGGDIASNIAVIMISKFLSDNLSELKTSDEIKSVISSTSGFLAISSTTYPNPNPTTEIFPLAIFITK